jgi:antitoxin VapB
MSVERQVKLFRNGRNQAVRIPHEFELAGNVALIHRQEERLMIEPLRRRGLLATLAKLPMVEEDFPDVDRGLLPLDSPD